MDLNWQGGAGKRPDEDSRLVQVFIPKDGRQRHSRCPMELSRDEKVANVWTTVKRFVSIQLKPPLQIKFIYDNPT